MDVRVRIAIELMDQEFSRDLSLEEIARHVNLSVSHLHHLFKKEAGDSPARCLRFLRIKHARELMETTLLSVKEVMHCVGLGDRSHFEREFKKRYGQTPAQCRAARLGTIFAAKAAAAGTDRSPHELVATATKKQNAP